MSIDDPIEKRIDEIVERYYQMNNTDIFFDIKGRADDLEEPFVVDFERELVNRREEKLGKTRTRDESPLKESDSCEVDLTNDASDYEIDLDKLHKIREKLSDILKYFQLSLYNEEQLHEFVVESLINDYRNQGLSRGMLEQITTIIRELLADRQLEENSKANLRKQYIVMVTQNRFIPLIDSHIEEFLQKEQANVSIKTLEAFSKYLTDKVRYEYAHQFKEDQKLSPEEGVFVEHILAFILKKKLTLLRRGL